MPAFRDGKQEHHELKTDGSCAVIWGQRGLQETVSKSNENPSTVTRQVVGTLSVLEGGPLSRLHGEEWKGEGRQELSCERQKRKFLPEGVKEKQQINNGGTSR